VSKERINELLTELNRELHATDDVDPETRELLARLNEDVERLAGDTQSSAIDRAKHLESRFAADHPVAERIARELADILAKMGI
jgi:hypothetical protein